MSTTQKNDHTDVLPAITGNSRTIVPKGERMDAGWCHLRHAGYVTQATLESFEDAPLSLDDDAGMEREMARTDDARARCCGDAPLHDANFARTSGTSVGCMDLTGSASPTIRRDPGATVHPSLDT